MDCFIKKIFSGNVDEQSHRQFVRFGKGIYPGRAVAVMHITGKVKLKGSYEYANDFALLASELGVKFSGIILSREKIDLSNEKKKSGVLQYEIENLDSSKLAEINNKAYCFLLDAEGVGITLKTKKKLPKPGKSAEAKIDDGFCVLEADLKYLPQLKSAFFWDVPEFKKARAVHEYKITDLVMPKGEKDFEKIRILTKRKGKIKRKLEIDGKEEIKELNFEV